MNGLRQYKILISVSSCLLLAGCGSSSEVSFQSGGMTHTMAEGGDATKQGFLLPIYPGAKPSGKVEAKGNAESSHFLLLNSDDPVNKISDFYQQELKKDGWEISQQQVLPNLVNLAAKKDQLEASVMVSGEDKTSSITLSVSRAPEGTPVVTDQTYTPDKLNPPTD